MSVKSLIICTGNFLSDNGVANEVVLAYPSMPFVYKLPNPLTTGWDIIVKGVPNADVKRFTVNLQSGTCCDEQDAYTPPNTCLMCDDISLHLQILFDFRGQRNQVIMNTYKNKWWGKRIFAPGSFPFKRSQPYTIRIKITSQSYLLYVDDAYISRFKHTMDINMVTYVIINGNTRITEFILHPPIGKICRL